MDCLRWVRILLLASVVGTGLIVACAQDVPASPSDAGPTATTPLKTEAATLAPGVSPIPATGAPAPVTGTTVPGAWVVLPPEIPTAVAVSRDGANGSLRLISSSSAAVPSRAETGLLSAGFSAGWASLGSHSSAAPQTAPVEGGLTVSAIGSVTVAAGEAYIVIMPERYFGPSGDELMTDEDRRRIRDNLAQMGVAEEAVEFGGQTGYGTAIISVEAGLDELAEMREQVLDAVEQVIRRYESYGVVYALSGDDCEEALSLARREAIPAAETAADDLAQALGVSRGMVTGALEYPLTGQVFGPFRLDINTCGAQGSSSYPNLVPFDAEPVVEVTLGLQITYGIR